MIDIGKMTWFQTKNLAKNFIQLTNDDDVQTLLSNFPKEFFCFGWWSNLLFSQPVYEKTFFIKNNLTWIKYLWENQWEVKAWENLWKFVSHLDEKGNNNLNPIFAIPWTIGWAVIGNAWSYGIEIWDFVSWLRYIDENWESIETDEYIYWYRYSNLKHKKIILTDIILEIPQENNPLRETKEHYMKKSLETKEYKKTCWSYFKNYTLTEKDNIEIFLEYPDFPARKNIWDDNIVVPAWWMIDKCWLRWWEMNWVKIADKHANFIQNLDNDDAENILNLAKFIKQKVFERFRVVLKEEVIIF